MCFFLEVSSYLRADSAGGLFRFFSRGCLGLEFKVEAVFLCLGGGHLRRYARSYLRSGDT